jgi:hypothetical protein
MRTWAKASLGVMAVLAVAFAALAGTSAYFVLRHLEKRQGSERDAAQAMDAVRTRFGSRPPLVELVDPTRGDIRIDRPVDSSPTRVDTIHVINWKSDTRELSRAEMPLWLLRFSSVNVLSQLGVAPQKFRLTVDDVERYGPGVLVDYGTVATTRILVWVD